MHVPQPGINRKHRAFLDFVVHIAHLDIKQVVILRVIQKRLRKLVDGNVTAMHQNGLAQDQPDGRIIRTVASKVADLPMLCGISR